MADSDEVDSVDQAVKALHKNKFTKLSSWTDDFSEFKSYIGVKSGKNFFFRMHQTSTDYRYSEDSHQRVSLILSGLLLPLEVERFEQGFERTVYLLQSDSNYVSLSEFIKIKSRNLEEADPKFIVHILNFLKKLIPILVSEQIKSELSLTTVCFTDDWVRLCDYNLFFYPYNHRSGNIGLQKTYLKKAACIIYSLLTYREPAELDPSEVTDLLLCLSERQPYKSNDLLRQVIRTLLLDNMLLQGKLQLLSQRIIYDLGASLTDSNITLKDSAVQDTIVGDYQLTKKNTMTTIADLTNDVKVKNTKKHIKMFLSVICILVLIFGIGACVYLFVFIPQICKSNQYKDGSNCINCADGCKKCVGQKLNECTNCWGDLWLVKQNFEDVAGTCEVECIGEKIIDGRMCISYRVTQAQSPNGPTMENRHTQI